MSGGEDFMHEKNYPEFPKSIENMKDSDIYAILLNHEKRISRLEGSMKIIITLLGLNTALLVTLIGLLTKVI